MNDINEFWRKIENSEVKVRDVESLKNILSGIWLKFEEIRKSRDKWKERCLKAEKKLKGDKLR